MDILLPNVHASRWGLFLFFAVTISFPFFYARRAGMPPPGAFPSLRGHFTCYFSLKMREKITWIAQIAQNTILPGNCTFFVLPIFIFAHKNASLPEHPPPLWIFPSNKRRLWNVQRRYIKKNRSPSWKSLSHANHISIPPPPGSHPDPRWGWVMHVPK